MESAGPDNVVWFGEVWEGNQNKNSKLFDEAYDTHGFCVGVGRYTCKYDVTTTNRHSPAIPYNCNGTLDDDHDDDGGTTRLVVGKQQQ